MPLFSSKKHHNTTGARDNVRNDNLPTGTGHGAAGAGGGMVQPNAGDNLGYTGHSNETGPQSGLNQTAGNGTYGNQGLGHTGMGHTGMGHTGMGQNQQGYNNQQSIPPTGTLNNQDNNRGGAGQRLTGKVETAVGSMVGSNALRAKGLQKEQEANIIKQQGQELAEAERLEREAMMRRERAVGHGAHPSNMQPGAGLHGSGQGF